MIATGKSAHHAEHVLCVMLMELTWELQARDDPGKAQSIYLRKLKKIAKDSAFRKKLTRKFDGDHSVFE
jgi:hypothetical protein